MNFGVRKGCGMVFKSTAFVSAAIAASAAVCGCKSSTGVRIESSSRSATSVLTSTVEETRVPILALYSGPSVTIWVNKDFFMLKSVEGCGAVTNTVSAFGVYVESEHKRAQLKAEFVPAATNGLTVATVEE